MATQRVQGPQYLDVPGSPDGANDDLVTVVLPCLDEEHSVGLVVKEALRTLQSAGIPGEVLVVDNGSVDRSAEVALAAGARVVREHRRGYGRAIRTGITEADGSIIVMADADWTYDMTKMPLLVEPIRRRQADIAIGSRLNEATRHTMPALHRYVGTPALSALIRRAGGYTKLPDSQSGFRCFRKEAVSALRLHSDGMEFATEMLIKSSHHNLRVLDIPTGYRKRIGSSKLNTLADGWRHLRLIVLLAPEIFFLAPGAVLFLMGTLLTVAAFLPSRGIEIGSLLWQPLFFATISLVLGIQTILVGVVFAWRRALLAGAKMSHGLSLVRARSFPPACSITGAVTLLLGIALDGLLFAKSIYGGPPLREQLPIASLAQSLLLVGGSIGSFGLVALWLHWDERQNRDET